MGIFMSAWSYFAKNILQQPAYFVGLMVLIGNLLLRKKWYETLASFLKAVVGYMILAVGSGGLINNCRPILAAPHAPASAPRLSYSKTRLMAGWLANRSPSPLRTQKSRGESG